MSKYTNNLCFARIHAHICGDGHIYIEKGERGKRYIVEYTNKSLELINSFIKDIQCFLGINPLLLYSNKKHVYIMRVKSKYLYQLLKLSGAGNSRSWRAEVFIDKAPIILNNWISAFIDDEGYVDRQKYRIIINSVNHKGLKDVNEIISKLNINSTIYDYSKKWGFYRLIISKRNNICNLYRNLTIFHSSKKKALMSICE